MKDSPIEKIVLGAAIAIPLIDFLSHTITGESVYHYIMPNMPEIIGPIVNLNLLGFSFII